MIEQKLKERLVGAAVLVAVAVIFIPIILTDSPEDDVITGSNIPERPEGLDSKFNSRIVPVDEEASISPSEPAAIRSESAAEVDEATNESSNAQAVAVEAVKTETPIVENIEAPEETGTEATSTESSNANVGLSAWIVQLGSFSSEENAESLKMKLRDAGFPAFVEPLKKDGKQSYRVRVGPEIKRSEAEKILKSLEDKMKLKEGIIVSYP